MTGVVDKEQTNLPASGSCSLSKSMERLALQKGEITSDHTGEIEWSPSFLAKVVVGLRQRGYSVKEPKGSSDDGKAAQVNWSDDTATAPGPFVEAQPAHPTEEGGGAVETEALARFHLLTSLMEQNRGEDGRVDALNLEHLLLSQDASAYEKEGVTQLRQYLMKAREGGVPIKFDSDRSGLHEVWFKGHKDLSGALARYSRSDGRDTAGPKSPHSPSNGRSRQDWDWRRREPYSSRHDSGGQQPFMMSGYTIRNSDMPNRYRTPSERAFDIDFLLDVLHSAGADFNHGADAQLVEQKLLEVAQGLYDIKGGVKRFHHYLMNMRASGAPIWFSRDDQGQPKEIFIKTLSSTPPHDSVPFPTPNLGPAVGGIPANDWNGYMAGTRSNTDQQQHQDRFASLVEAYQFYLQPEDNVADGHLVQSRLQAMDSDIYSREQCSSFKHLLKLAKMSGLDLNWEQDDTGVASIRMRLRPHLQQPYHHQH